MLLGLMLGLVVACLAFGANDTNIAIRDLQTNLDKIGKTAERSVTVVTRMMVKECLSRIKTVVDQEMIRIRIY